VITIRQIRSEIPGMLRLAVPLAMAELGWILMHIVDIAMVGRLGADAIAAVSVGTAVFHVFAIVSEGLLLGLDALVSQQYGAGKLDECHRSLWAAIQFALPLSLVMIVLIWAAVPVLPIIGIAPAVTGLTGPFLRALAWSLPPLLLFFGLRRYLQAMHLVRIIPFALISANLVNFGFNYALIYGRFGLPAMGPEGSGWSTTISRTYMLGVLVLYTLAQNRKRNFRIGRFVWPLHGERIREIVKLGIPAAAQIGLEVGAFAASTLIAGRLGAVIVSGHQIAISMASLTFMVPLGIASATAVRVGNAVGRRDPEGANAAGWTGVGVSAAFMSMAAVVFWTLPHPIASIFTRDPQVLSLAVSLLLIAAVFQFFDGVQVTAIGALRGSGDTRTAMLTNIVGWWVVGLPLGAYLCFVRGWGAKGIWIGLCTGLILIGCILAVAWRRRVHWMRMATAEELQEPTAPELI